MFGHGDTSKEGFEQLNPSFLTSTRLSRCYISAKRTEFEAKVLTTNLVPFVCILSAMSPTWGRNRTVKSPENVFPTCLVLRVGLEFPGNLASSTNVEFQQFTILSNMVPNGVSLLSC